MEPLLEQLKSLPSKWQTLNRGTRMLLIGSLVGRLISAFRKTEGVGAALCRDKVAPNRIIAG